MNARSVPPAKASKSAAAPPAGEPEIAPFRADLANHERKRARRRRSLTAAFTCGLILALMAGGLAGWTYFFADLPDIPPSSALWSLNRAPGMTFEDRSGVVIATRGPRHGLRVRPSDLPLYVTRAFLAAEDRRFYSHGAVDIKGTTRALFADAAHRRVVQGGSTLTQQIAKTLFLKPDRTIKRKVQEAVLAYELEQRMTKDEVLELYLNRIYFGAASYGLDAASQTYFAKPAANLTLSEAALLAALPKAPSKLALNNDVDAALARSKLVLANMREEGWITPAEEAQALAARPVLAAEPPGEGEFGYLLDMASVEAVKIAGASAPDLVVRLSIDSALQTKSQEILYQVVETQGRRLGARQGSLVLLAPDGAIRALVGGVDHRESPYNRAVQAKRQPGSSFKPFIYAAALENGVRPGDIVQDRPISLGGWTPANYGGGYRGAVTVQDALARSINTIAVRLGAQVGRQKLGEIAHRFGLASIPDNPALSISLGAYEVNLLELTAGYQVFQNGGGRTRPYLIESITTSRGDPLYLHAASAPIPVYDPARAGMMVRMMEGVIGHGTGTRAALGRPAAGKTGTSQNWRDAWFIGFTPDYAAGVWVGNDESKPMAHVTGGTLPAEIWRRVMLVAHKDLPPRNFDWLPAEQYVTAPPMLATNADDGLDVTPQPAALRETRSDGRAPFYENLSADFDRAAGPGDAPSPPTELRLRRQY